MASTEEYATLALDAYRDDGVVPTELYGWNINRGMEQFGVVDPNFSARAYEKGNEIVIPYRGTDATDELIFTSIITSWLGGTPDQVLGAYNFYKAVEEANPEKMISSTGHYLGGALASAIATREGLVCRYCSTK